MARRETFTLFKKSDAEGYLDKINSSKWLPGKTRMWCELFGSTLYMFKDNKRSSTGAQQLDMAQVHTVRKATSDKTGIQFEILGKNKSHIFNAPSEGECTSWIRQLQTAMMLKEQDQEQHQTLTQSSRVSSTGDYETIVLPEDNPTSTCIKIGASSMSDPGYTEVEIFQKPPTLSQTNVAGSVSSLEGTSIEGDDGYSRVEFRTKPDSGKPTVEPAQKSRDSDLPSAFQPIPDKGVVEEDSYGYAKVEVRKNRISESEQSQPSELVARTETESREDLYGYATVKKTAEGTVVVKTEDSSCTAADGASEDSSDEDDVFRSAAHCDAVPIPPLPHPLQPEDLQPLAALKEFLSDNRKLCRPSFIDKTVTEDPVEDMKRLLEELRL